MLIHVNTCYEILWYTLYLMNLSLPWIIVLIASASQKHLVGLDGFFHRDASAGWSLRSGAWAIPTSRTSWARPCSWLRVRRWPTQWGLAWAAGRRWKWDGAGSMSREVDGFGDVFGCLSFDFRGKGLVTASWRSANENRHLSHLVPLPSVTFRDEIESSLALKGMACSSYLTAGDGSKPAPYPHGFRSNLRSCHRLSIWILDVFGIPSGLTSSHLQLFEPSEAQAMDMYLPFTAIFVAIWFSLVSSSSLEAR